MTFFCRSLYESVDLNKHLLSFRSVIFCRSLYESVDLNPCEMEKVSYFHVALCTRAWI